MTNSMQQKPSSHNVETQQHTGHSQSRLACGFYALKQLKEITNKIAQAKAQAHDTEQSLQQKHATLERRRYVEKNYEAILSSNTLALQELAPKAQAYTARVDDQTTKTVMARRELSATKETHEQELAPYQQLFDAAKEHLDDCARYLAEAKRAQKTLEAQVASSKENLQNQLSSTEISIKNCHARIEKLQLQKDEYDAEQNEEQAQRINQALLQEKKNLERALQTQSQTKALLERSSVENATNSEEGRLALKKATAAHEEAKADFERKKQDYTRLKEQFNQEEQRLQDGLSSQEVELARVKEALADIQHNCQVAQGAIDEAHSVHATPQETEELTRHIQADQERLANINITIASLQNKEARLRETSKKDRMAFIALVIAIVLVIVGIVCYLVFIR